MSDWAEFAAALGVFLISHMVPVRPPVRPWLVRHLGLRAYLTGYSLVSLALLVWLFAAVARAPFVAVLPPLIWVPLVVMPLVCALIVAGLSAANPLSFGGMGRGPYDPERPGMLAVTRHPLLLAVTLWALAHLLANGDLAHVILFGLFAAFAWLGMAGIDARRRRTMGVDEWQRLAGNTSRLSLRALRHVRPRVWQVAATAALYGALLVLHGPVIGVSPLP